jgi:uncharacterized damage-inducible protein DinB
VASPTEVEWAGVLRRLEDSHRRVGAAMANPDHSLERIQYLVPHDAYHAGQIMYLRALQGLPPIE